jgi:hypothetical protein
MTVAPCPIGHRADWCVDFVKQRCGEFIWAALKDEVRQAEPEGAVRAPVLSLIEIDVNADAQRAAGHDHLVLLALGVGGGKGGSVERHMLRFVMPSVMRSAGRASGSRWIVNDVPVATPGDVLELSFLVYRVPRTTRLQRVLGGIENAVEALEAAPDGEELFLAHAALDRLESLDEAEIIMGGHRLRFGEAINRGEERFLAGVRSGPEATGATKLWLVDRRLREGRDPVSATPVSGTPYALFRLGRASDRQSVRDFIAEIRRRHRRRGGEGERFTSVIDREINERREKDTQTRRSGFVSSLGLETEARLPIVTPIVLEISDDLVPLVDGSTPNGLSEAASRAVEAMRERIKERLGVRIPGIRFRGNPGLAACSYQILLFESAVANRQYRTDKRFLPTPALTLVALGRSAEPGHHPQAGDGSWLALDDHLESDGPLWEALDYPIYDLEGIVADNLEEFLGYEEVCNLLSAAEHEAAKTIDADPKLVAMFANVLRRLVRERVPILTVDAICERFLQLEATHMSMLRRVQQVRMIDGVRALLPGNQVDRTFIHIGPTLIGWVRGAIRTETSPSDVSGSHLRLDPDLAQQVVARVRTAVADAQGPCTVIVPDGWVRLFFWRLLQFEIARLPVLAAEEVSVQPASISRVDAE